MAEMIIRVDLNENDGFRLIITEQTEWTDLDRMD